MQAVTATHLHVLIEQSMPTANLCSGSTARHPGLHLLTRAQSPSKETAAILIFKALQLSAIVQSHPRTNWALCPEPRTPLLKEFSCQPQFCTLSHSTWILKQGTYPARQYWIFQKPAGSLPMPLLILTVFGFVKLYLCSTMAWNCLVNQVQPTDQLWLFTACTTEGLCIWRNHQPHQSLPYQQQSLYSLPRESWGKCALQQKQYARGAAEPTT